MLFSCVPLNELLRIVSTSWHFCRGRLGTVISPYRAVKLDLNTRQRRHDTSAQNGDCVDWGLAWRARWGRTAAGWKVGFWWKPAHACSVTSVREEGPPKGPQTPHRGGASVWRWTVASRRAGHRVDLLRLQEHRHRSSSLSPFKSPKENASDKHRRRAR